MPLGTAFERACTTLIFTSLLEVLIVLRVKRIGFRFHLRVTDYRSVGEMIESIEGFSAFLVLAFCTEYPPTLSIVLPIFVFYPR